MPATEAGDPALDHEGNAKPFPGPSGNSGTDFEPRLKLPSMIGGSSPGGFRTTAAVQPGMSSSHPRQAHLDYTPVSGPGRPDPGPTGPATVDATANARPVRNRWRL